MESKFIVNVITLEQLGFFKVKMNTRIVNELYPIHNFTGERTYFLHLNVSYIPPPRYYAPKFVQDEKEGGFRLQTRFYASNDTPIASYKLPPIKDYDNDTFSVKLESDTEGTKYVNYK
jgi:hypothetical protein